MLTQLCSRLEKGVPVLFHAAALGQGVGWRAGGNMLGDFIRMTECEFSKQEERKGPGEMPTKGQRLGVGW